MSPPLDETAGPSADMNRRNLMRLFALAGAVVTVGANGLLSASPAQAAASTLWPNASIEQPFVSDPFGAPREGGRTHRGTDFVGFRDVSSVAAGTVVVRGTPSGWSAGGNQIWIDHDAGYRSRYLHLASFSVSVGQRVQVGEKVGVMGNTGGNYGVHLHLEIDPSRSSSDANSVDPIPFLTPRINAPQPPEMIGTDTKMEVIVSAPNGIVAHLRPGGKTNFGSAAEYNTFRDQINFLRNAGATDIMALPPLANVPGVTWDTFGYLCRYIGAPEN
ncbi:M23 family metallopeptidase [Microbacterium resistens]|uniref:M23 family metallopeptidase n=1 Tax=Microbacterium resistens TaxID=156977 RepID=UPI0022F07D47|nr:M23 family metallopeptidase [Streptomyces sp. MS2A]